MSKPVKTETTVRQYDAEGELVAETVTVVTMVPVPTEPPSIGMYL